MALFNVRLAARARFGDSPATATKNFACARDLVYATGEADPLRYHRKTLKPARYRQAWPLSIPAMLHEAAAAGRSAAATPCRPHSLLRPGDHRCRQLYMPGHHLPKYPHHCVVPSSASGACFGDRVVARGDEACVLPIVAAARARSPTCVPQTAVRGEPGDITDIHSNFAKVRVPVADDGWSPARRGSCRRGATTTRQCKWRGAPLPPKAPATERTDNFRPGKHPHEQIAKPA